MSGLPVRRSARTRKELKRKSEELALTERWVFLVLSVVLALTSVVSPFIGVHGPFPTTTGVGAGLSALAGYIRR
jgi:hypothetical protein